MPFQVTIRKKVLKGLPELPANIQKKFWILVHDLQTLGPKLPHWPNYSPLGKVTYHCHLSYSWIACWRCEQQSVEIEVYYAGSREDAPY